MKTSSEYRALAWKELRTLFGASSKIMLLPLVAFFFSIFLLALTGYSLQETAMLGIGRFCMSVALLCSFGILYYYLPVWFLSLVRNKTFSMSETKSRYGRVLCATILMLVPSILQETLKTVMGANASPGYVFGMLCISIIALFVMVIWFYAISIILPYIVHDQKELSVWQALKRSVQLSDGYKVDMFGVDMKIAFLPLFIFFLLMALAQYARSGDMIPSSALTPIAIGIIVIGLFLVFITFPMLLFAHAHFYEDLRADKELSEPETTDIIQSV